MTQDIDPDTSEIFGNMDVLRERFLRDARIVEYEKGQVIRTAGDRRPAILHLARGIVALELPRITGHDKLLAPMFSGMTFNVIDMVNGWNMVTVRAMSKVIIYELDANIFMAHKDSPAFLRWCMWVMSRNQMLLFEYRALSSIPDLEARLIKFFKLFYNLQNGRPPDGTRFDVEWPLSQKILAAMLNVSRPYLNERLKLMSAAGIIRPQGKTIHVDLGRLQAPSDDQNN